MTTNSEMNRNAYNLVAANYQAEHTEKIEWEAELTKFIHYLGTDHAHVVDLGSGPGTEAIWLADHLQNGIVEAVDIAEEMLSVFSRIPKNLYPVAADMVYYQPDTKMDGIWARASIHHLTKTETVELFSTIKKYLKPNGIVFMINKYGSEEEIEEKQKYGQVIRRYFQYFDKERVELLAKDNGFSVEEQYIVQNDHKWLISVLMNS